MKLFLVLVLGLTLVFTACDKSAKGDTGKTAPKSEVEIPKDAKTYTVACGKCIFKEKAASGCPAWVQIDGKNYPITGKVADAHATGLCNHEMKAQMTGEIKDGSFVSTFMHVEADGHDHGHKH